MGTKQFDNYADLITFTRASGGTALRPISYGSELVTNGTFDSDVSGWVAGNNSGSISWNNGAGDVENDGTSFNMGVSSGITLEIGKVYQISASLISETVSNSYFSVSSLVNNKTTNTQFGDVLISVGETKTVVFVATISTAYVHIFAQGTGISTFDNISVKEVLFDQPNAPLTLFNHPTNIPRIEYDADGNRLGLLVEEQRTNLFTYSEDFSDAVWTKSNTTISTNVATAPDGLLTADKLVKDSGLNGQFYGGGASVTSGVIYTFSLFAKKGEYDFIKVAGGGAAFGNTGTTVNLNDGSFTTDGSFVGGVTPVGDGWYKITASRTSNSTGSGSLVVFCGNDSSVNTLGDGTSGVYIWGAQLEAGAFPTSYIPTSGSTATRAADVASITGADFKKWYRQGEGSVIIETTGGQAGQNVFGLGSALANSIGAWNFFRVYYNNTLELNVDISPTGNDRFGIGIKVNNVSVIQDGNVLFTNSSVNVPEVDKLSIGSASPQRGEYANGHIKSIKYYPRRLTNAQLQELTQ